MANVRLLRQRLTDYNTAIDRINSRYRRDYNAYAGKVEAWNAIAKATPYVTAVESLGGSYLMPSGQREAVLSNNERVRVPQGQSANPGDYYNNAGFREEQVYNDLTNRYETVQVPNISFSKYPAAAGEIPIEPVMGKTPRQPNLTENDIRAIQDPPTNAAGVEMARAKGWTGVSELVAENEDRARITAFESAFDNPDNPQALKDRGILAKTLAGKL